MLFAAAIAMSGFSPPPSDVGVIRAAPCTSPCAPSAAPWILAATILASSMVFIDGTVVNVALPALQRELNASLIDVQWVVEAYALFLAALLLVGGAAGDRFGRRRVFLAGVALFAMSSVWCGLAGGVRELILARVLQGIGGALLVPGSLAIISASFAEQDRGKAIGTWSGATAVTAALGPVLGGWLIDHLSWRAAFFINLPLAIVIIPIAMQHVTESHSEGIPGGLDWPGALLVTLGLGAIVYGLIESSNVGWENRVIIASILLGVLALSGFIAVEMNSEAPMMPMRLFRSSAFTGANLLTLLLYAALGGSLFFVPLNLIQVQGYSTTAAGAALLPLILLVSTLSRWSGGLVERYGAKAPLVIGPAVAAGGFALFAVPGVGGSYWVTFFPAVLVLGLGMAISVAPLTTVVMNSAGPTFAGAASGINNAASRVAALLAVALFGLIMTSTFGRDLHRQLESAELMPDVTEAVEKQRNKLAAIELPASIDAHDAATAKRAIADAFVAGFRWIMLISAALALAGAASALILIGDAKQRTRAGGQS
jgi:EmrB/QacA subfamily drug resistance transporter